MKRLILILIVVFATNACQKFNNTASFPEFVQWSTSSVSIDENATEPIEIEVQLVGALKSSPIDVTFDITENNVAEGVNYTFPNGKNLTIAPNSSTATLQIATIDNEVIAPGEQSIILTLTNAGPLSVGDDTSPKKSIKVIINENDFFCPRNDLAKVVTTEEDSNSGNTGNVSIELSATADGCYAFTIIGGGSVPFGQNNTMYYGDLVLIEDSPESQTGTFEDGIFPLYWISDDSPVVSGGGDPFSIQVTGGAYDLTAGTFEVEAVYLLGSTPVYATTLLYY